jgi:septation ring formation regulator EzrA
VILGKNITQIVREISRYKELQYNANHIATHTIVEIAKMQLEKIARGLVWTSLRVIIFRELILVGM